MFYYLLFFAFSLGQIGRISLQNQAINFYVYEILLFGYFIYLFNKFKFSPIKNPKLKGLYFFPLALLISFLIPLFNYSLIQNTNAFLYLLRTGFYFIFGLYLYKHFSLIKNKKDVLTPGIILSIISILLTSFVQYFLYPNLRNLTYLGWDPHQFRIFGVFFDTSISAAIFGLIILYLLLKFKSFSFSPMSRYLLLIAFIILGLLTYSRGFYISIFITFIFYLFKTKKIQYLILSLFIFLISIYILPRPFGEGVNLLRKFSIKSRVQENISGAKIWSENPFFGIGYNRLKSINTTKSQYPEHSVSAYPSSFITVLVTSGLLGLIFFLYALRDFWNYSKISKYYVLFLSIFSFMDNIFLHPLILFLFLFLVNDS